MVCWEDWRDLVRSWFDNVGNSDDNLRTTATLKELEEVMRADTREICPLCYPSICIWQFLSHRDLGDCIEFQGAFIEFKIK